MDGENYRIGYDRPHEARDPCRVWQLASVIGEIALRRRGPESLPDSTFLAGLLFAVFVVLNLIYLLLQGGLSWLGLGNLAAQLVLVFGFVFAVLTFFKLERRYRQTMSAFLGVNIVVLLVYFPLALGGLALNIDLAGVPFGLVRLVLFLWSVTMEAHIFARALSQPLLLGFMVEILYVLSSLSISESFTPAAD
jgi:hypothetical protein